MATTLRNVVVSFRGGAYACADLAANRAEALDDAARMAANRTQARSGVIVRAATISDVYAIATRMRGEDAAEARALNRCPKRALRASFRASLTPPRVAVVRGQVAAIWGVGGDILSDVGHPWLVTTAAVERVPVSFVRVGTNELAAMLEVKPRLENYVAAQYGKAIAFLRFVGFVVEAPAPVGRTRALFCRFWIDRASTMRGANGI